MANVRKRHSAEFKAKVAIEAIKQHKTLNELTAEYAVHATQIHNWKKQALQAIPTAFATHKQAAGGQRQPYVDEIFQYVLNHQFTTYSAVMS